MVRGALRIAPSDIPCAKAWLEGERLQRRGRRAHLYQDYGHSYHEWPSPAT